MFLAHPPPCPPKAWWYLSGHVHEQDSSNGCLGLAVALLRSVECVGLQHTEQILLAVERPSMAGMTGATVTYFPHLCPTRPDLSQNVYFSGEGI